MKNNYLVKALRNSVLIIIVLCIGCNEKKKPSNASVIETDSISSINVSHVDTIFSIRPLPGDVIPEGHAKDAKEYGYRIPSLLVTNRNSILAFSERRLGLHDHAQNDIVLKRSVDGGKTWGPELVVFEDGMNSINDPLTVQLKDGRIMLMFARFPYGRHARNSGWIKMAEPGYDDPNLNILTYVMHSDDDGLTWSDPVDITRSVKPSHWLNSNTPGAMIQLEKGPHKGRIIASLWGSVPVKNDDNIERYWEIIAAWSDDMGNTWQRSEPLEDPEIGYPSESQIAEASNGDLVIISRNEEGEAKRKKAYSTDSGESWSVIETDPGLPSVACMGSIIKGPKKNDGTWDLYASFPSNQGRKDGQIAVSKDHGQSWEIKGIIKGDFAYSVLQVSSDKKHLLCLYETNSSKNEILVTIPFKNLLN